MFQTSIPAASVAKETSTAATTPSTTHLFLRNLREVCTTLTCIGSKVCILGLLGKLSTMLKQLHPLQFKSLIVYNLGSIINHRSKPRTEV
ncbi:hypothetical protein D3C81_761130 [compost metagenome]